MWKTMKCARLPGKAKTELFKAVKIKGKKKEKEKVKKVEKHRLRVFVGPSQVNFSSDLIHGLHRSWSRLLFIVLSESSRSLVCIPVRSMIYLNSTCWIWIWIILVSEPSFPRTKFSNLAALLCLTTCYEKSLSGNESDSTFHSWKCPGLLWVSPTLF